MKRTLCLASAAVALGLGVATLALPTPITHSAVLVEDFTARWCGPCASAHDLLDRKKPQWGDEIAILTYNISDAPLSNSYTERRASEWGVSAIPTLAFMGKYKQVGTPSDQAFDNYINNCKVLPQDLDMIANYSVDNASKNVRVKVKIRPKNRALTVSYDLRIVVWERQYLVNWYRSDFKYRVMGGLDVPLFTLKEGKVVKGIVDLDLDAMGPYQEWDDVGVTIYLYQRNTKEVAAAWEIGEQSLGDLNNDLKINAKDGAAYQNQVGKKLGDPGFNKAADWDQDGDVDAVDTQLFRDYVLGGGLR